jgi:hypothetical protein
MSSSQTKNRLLADFPIAKSYAPNFFVRFFISMIGIKAINNLSPLLSFVALEKN